MFSPLPSSSSPPLSLSLVLCLARSLVALALTGRTINVSASVWGCATFWGIQMWPQLSRNENFNFLSSAFIAHNYKSPKAVAAASGQPHCHMPPRLLLLHGATCLPLCWGNTGCTRYSILHFTTNACLTIFSWRAKISHVPLSLSLCLPLSLLQGERHVSRGQGKGSSARALCLSFT